MNFLFLDGETTGLSAERNDIIQLACIPIMGGKTYGAFNEYCQPIQWNNIDQGAVKVHGITVDRMKTFQTSAIMLEKFIAYVKSFKTKFIIAGFNVSFDKKFIGSWFAKHHKTNLFFELFELQIHDTYLRAQKVKTLLKTENLKLVTLAKHFNIEINAHDALSDISATIDLDKKIGSLLGEEETEEVEISSTPMSSSYTFPEPAQLHVHSMYGMVESVPDVKDWVKWCESTNTPGFSVVDHNSAISLHHARTMSNPKVTIVPGSGLNIVFDSDPETIHPFNAWAISNEGYFNLMKLSSLGYNNTVTEDGITISTLRESDIALYHSGLRFCLSDVYSPIGKALLDGDAIIAEAYVKEFVRLFGNDIYIEFNPISITHQFSNKLGFQKIKRNAIIKDGDWNKSYNIFLSNMVDKFNLKCIPSCGAHFISPDDKIIQQCISSNSYSSGKSYIESYHAKNASQIFSELKVQLGDWLTETKYLRWIENSHHILEEAKTIKISFDYHLPKIAIPEHIAAKTDDYNKQTLLLTIELCKKHGRWNDDPIYVARFKREIDVIVKNESMNFLPYFLMYEDICSYARSIGIVQNIGRGSAGGCLLSFYLKIIHLDPIKHELPFERFLSHARIRAGSFPDIDSDYGSRTEILKYLESKYKLGFAQICTIQKMKTKNAIKDAMWALYGRNREDFEIKQICDLIPDSPQGVEEHDFLYGHVDKEGIEHKGVVEIVPEVARFFEQYKQVEDTIKRLIGIPRGWGRHASAFVISTLDLSSQRVPTLKMFDKHQGQDILVTQYEATMVEKCGLVKADILGVTTINMVTECVKLVKERTGLDYLEEDSKGVALLYRLPEVDSVYADFYNRKTDSSFQFNTSLIKSYLQQFIPSKVEDLAVLTALCRPGALDAPLFDTTATQFYVDVKNKRRPLEYLHPDLTPFLKETNGVIVFQEQLIKILVELIGYSWEESDQIRSAIAKKKHSVMTATFTRVRETCLKRGWKPEVIEIFCQQIQAFSNYSFNKSHSFCYSMLGYITMYLKHFHPLEWWASVLNHTDEEEKTRSFIHLLGDKIQPPSLKVTVNKFTIHGDHIVSPMSAIKRVGAAAVAELVSKGPFNDIDDYIAKVSHNKVNAGHFAAMIQARAADCFMDNSLPYAEARAKFIKEYRSKRGIKKELTEDMAKVDPLHVYMKEREFNKCFNKTLIEDLALRNLVMNAVPALVATHKIGVPLYIGRKTPVLAGVRIAEGLVERKFEEEIAMILMFNGSAHKSGISKKSGKEYNFLKIDLSDGASAIEAAWWDKKSSLKWPIGSLVLVIGTLAEGWKGGVRLTIKEMEKIDV